MPDAPTIHLGMFGPRITPGFSAIPPQSEETPPSWEQPQIPKSTGILTNADTFVDTVIEYARDDAEIRAKLEPLKLGPVSFEKGEATDVSL